MTLGARVRDIRQKTGLSQVQLGERAGLHVNHVSEIERGHRDPRFSTVVKLAGGLQVTLSMLMWDVDA